MLGSLAGGRPYHRVCAHQVVRPRAGVPSFAGMNIALLLLGLAVGLVWLVLMGTSGALWPVWLVFALGCAAIALGMLPRHKPII
jgi:hypothetical protein